MNHVEVSRVIAASPEALFDVVSDLPRMCELSSEEHKGGEWIGGATGPGSGAKFKGRNANGTRKWSTVATVESFDPPREFGFGIKGGPGIPVARWTYRFEPVDGGTKVTESWDDRRGRFIKVLGRVLSGVTDRPSTNRAAMEHTLATLAARVRSNPEAALTRSPPCRTEAIREH